MPAFELTESLLGPPGDLAHVLDRRRDRGQLLEGLLRGAGDHLRDRGLARCPAGPTGSPTTAGRPRSASATAGPGPAGAPDPRPRRGCAAAAAPRAAPAGPADPRRRPRTDPGGRRLGIAARLPPGAAGRIGAVGSARSGVELCHHRVPCGTCSLACSGCGSSPPSRIYAYRLYRRFTHGAAGRSARPPRRTGRPRLPCPSSARRRAATSHRSPATDPSAPAHRAAGSTGPSRTDASPSPVPASSPPTAIPGPCFALLAAATCPTRMLARRWPRSCAASPCRVTCRPLVDPDRVFDPYRVAFATNTAPAATVGASIGDELERLEFTLASTADQPTRGHQGRATRDRDDPRRPRRGHLRRGPAFRNAPPGGVVVEFQT